MAFVFEIEFQTSICAVVRVTAPQEITSLEEAKAWAEEQSCDASICASCSGWGQDYSLDIGEWQPAEDRNGNCIEPRLVEGK